MPRNVRNFWIQLEVDGRKLICAGPQRKDGEFKLKIFVRERGEISAHRLFIDGECEGDQLRVVVYSVKPASMKEVFELETKR